MFELVVMMVANAAGLLLRLAAIHQDRLLAVAGSGGLAELVGAGRRL